MKLLKNKNEYIKKIWICLFLTISLGVGVFISKGVYDKMAYNNKNIEEEVLEASSLDTDTNNAESNEQYQVLLEHLFDYRNKAILDQDTDILKELYDTNKKFGLWAYEHEVKKMKYIENWSNKQGVNFNDIKTRVVVKKFKEKEEDLYGIICTVSTEYKYSYENEPDVTNMFRIGTYHYLNVVIRDDQYVIVKEWYTDPFEDSLNLDNIDTVEIENYIKNHEKVEVQLTNEQQKAINYAHQYCGAAADEEYGFKYNKNYRDFNPEGGDCANFASQILYESGRFKKNDTWNFNGKDGTKAWVNAQGFKNYMIYSGRAQYITKGAYNDVYKEAYNLRPGDIVGYEKGGRITHVSTVTGLDSKGYPLVTCHNTDRYLVPWDLGWSNKDIKFHLIKVNY
ncbi:Putative amidase domain [uncultured Clostridium sp.]|nr:MULTISPECIES: amidase domain-containing protein [unclassified Romboutsia]SCH03537.1 Putative amidase domain [uncultured Clostridium sp.]